MSYRRAPSIIFLHNLYAQRLLESTIRSRLSWSVKKSCLDLLVAVHAELLMQLLEFDCLISRCLASETIILNEANRQVAEPLS